MAMAARRERGLFDPETAAGESPFDHHIYVIASDGDIEEGVTSEASSIAGVQQLGNLTVFYDDNKISIEDDTAIALGEDVATRYEAYGWHVQVVDGGEDVSSILEAAEAAEAVVDRPSIILLRTVIGFPAPKKMNTGGVHGAALGADEVAGVKRALGFDPDKSFDVDPDVLAHARRAVDRGDRLRAQWQKEMDAWATREPERFELFSRLQEGALPDGWADALPVYEPGSKGVATRKASGAAINALAPVLPELWGGSADLAGSNNTTIDGADSFGPVSISTKDWNAQPYGRNLHFGIREHAMGSIINGIVLHGPTRPYGGTFLVFSDYMRPAVRLAAVMKTPAIYVWTHDSIGLGEDGPTHQPVEHIASLRNIPNVAVIRPGDANETSQAWRAAVEHTTGPVALALTRQDVPILDGTREKAAEGVSRGGYVLADASTGKPEIVLIGTGSELQLAVAAREALEADGVPTRVVSMPCLDWFESQDRDYRDLVVPPTVKARVSVEAGLAISWYRLLGDAGEAVSLEHFGASADGPTLFHEFGITTEAVIAAARRSLAKVKG
jgi:transketolase